MFLYFKAGRLKGQIHDQSQWPMIPVSPIPTSLKITPIPLPSSVDGSMLGNEIIHSINQSIPLTGEDFDWEKETKNPKIAKKLVLSTKEKLDLLLKYLDIVRIPLPKSTKNGTLKKTNVTNGVAKQVR